MHQEKYSLTCTFQNIINLKGNVWNFITLHFITQAFHHALMGVAG